MFSRIPTIAAYFLAAVAVSSLLRAAEPAPPEKADQQILVLRNGQTFEGRVTQQEGTYVIDLSDGQIRIKAADVDLICGSLQEGYERKRVAVQPGDAHNHLELAQWCLRHGLLGPAAAELADAKAAEPNNPMIGAIEHRLKLALEPPPTAATAKPIVGPSNDELDRMIRNLPHGSVEAFTQLVQPVLTNHCATAGCHGPQSETGLRLFRVPIGKTASRRITQRNLYAVLLFVDRDNPAASRLLAAPSGPHGTSKIAIFNEHQAAQYKRLAEWVSELSGQAATPEGPLTINPMLTAEASGPSSGVPARPPQVH